ncbi:HalOD1 output domain-containing protein [Halomarina salina]|uniref:HalOD1 output domain-containing protein n=1 Tax=Halomarina salina TaxID=1872699 RepID=A0ABD5RKT9_9EURY|nr:HalOD1 output domain-containing protein [Halomarina salina]
MVPSSPDRPNRESERYVSYYDPTGSRKLSTILVHRLADLMGTDVRRAERVLYESIDPVSLDRLFQQRHDGSARYDGLTRFRVDGYAVVITADGRIEITPHDPPEE